MDEKLLQHFKQLTPVEQEQRATKFFINDFNDKTLLQTTNKKYVPIFTEEFFKGKSIYVSKHNRFAKYPKHTHTFLEMNYMLSGSANEKVNGHDLILKKGDILLLGVGTTHSIDALSTNDILINIIFRNNISFSLENLRTIGKNKNVLSSFILANNKSEDFMVFRKKHTENSVRNIADAIIEEYYSNKEFSDKLIDSYLNSLLILLSRNTNIHSNKVLKENTPEVILDILKKISSNNVNLSLSEIAKEKNYSRSYLGDLFKKTVGKSFSDVLTEQRLLNAYNLLNSTNLSISDIIQKVGISNKTFFYKKFKTKFRCLPSEIRR